MRGAVVIWVSLAAVGLAAIQDVDNRAERKAFVKLYNERRPAQRRAMAGKFLADYPASWHLAEVYEIAAKACIELNDAPCAVDMGARSLRLLPENPLLLVPVAEVLFETGAFDRARDSATEALEYLDRFATPAERELRLSAWSTLARVYSAQALATRSRGPLLEQALGAATHAVALSPGDAQLAYMRGLILVALGRAGESRADFQRAAARPGPLQERARAQLTKLPAATAGHQPGHEPATADRIASRAAPPREYAGSDACKTCHPAEFEAWQRTGMAKMLRPYRSENIIGDFADQHFARAGDDPIVYMKADRDRRFFQIRAEDSTWHRYNVDFTIGSKWQQAYATQLADGRIQVLPIQYNRLHHQWVNYWERIDPKGGDRADIETFERMPESGNFQKNCAPCHTSQLRSGPNHDETHATFAEPGINCEMCHGPSAAHTREPRARGKAPLDPPVDFPALDNRNAVRICAQCHMQSAIREPAAESGGFPNFRQRPYADFLRKAFYKDGRFRETTFIVESFMRSRCYRKGGAQCGTCHNPHAAGPETNPTSFKFAANPDEMCLQCHTNLRANAEQHTHHPAASEGSRCQSCHMPRIMNSLLFKARSHQIDDIPTAEDALRFGEADSPIACLDCHPGKGAAWVQRELRSWSQLGSAPR